MSEEGRELDLKKIEEEAFLAIDEIFSEEPIETKEEANKDILALEEAILALDWEISDKELKKIKLPNICLMPY